MFVTRLISGIVLVAVALLTVISGNWVLFFTCLALSLIAAGEFFNAVKVRPEDKPFGVLDTAGYIIIAGYYACVRFLEPQYTLLPIVLGFLVIMGLYVAFFPKYKSHEVFAAITGVLYTGVMICFLYQTRMLENGNIHVWLIFLSAWGCDTCAYCAGMLFGKHKMTPVLSPKKTIEGGIGGVVGACILGIIYAVIFKQNIMVYAIICAAGAVISMFGDLAASAIKRNMEIKDYGHLIPGHGGILDRFDSIIFTAPVIYYLSLILL